MELSTQTLSRARKLGAVAVIGSAAAVALAAVMLPPAVAGLLPVLALMTPFLAAGIVEGAIDTMDQGGAHA